MKRPEVARSQVEARLMIQFGVYEWCMTDKYDASNPYHKKVAHGIEVSNSDSPAVERGVRRYSLQASRRKRRDTKYGY
jgi:hypothetical protein